VAGTDEGRESWISDEGGRGQVTFREKEKFIARNHFISCLAIKMLRLARRRRLHPKWGTYTTTIVTMSLSVQLFDPLGRINLV
jgi:nucleoside recognition membrane protein YjiH